MSKIRHIRITWGYRLKTTFLDAGSKVDRIADERITLTHNDPLKQADKIGDLKCLEERYRSLAEVIGGLSRSWDQKIPGHDKSYYTFLARNGFGLNGNSILTIEELKSAEKVFYSGWILPIGTKHENLGLPVVGSKKLLFGKCPRCGEMQLIVRRYRRKGTFWWFTQKTDFNILCLDCRCVYAIQEGVEILETTN